MSDIFKNVNYLKIKTMNDIEIFFKIKLPINAIWAKDGSKLAYIVEGLNGSDIMVHSITSGTSQRLVTNLPPATKYVCWRAREREDRQELRWNEDGQKILFNKKFTYFTIPATGGEPDLLVSGKLLGERVQLSPDENHLSFVRDGDLWVKPVVGGDPRQLTAGEDLLANPICQLIGDWHQWSPDGSKIGIHAAYPERWKSNLGVVSLEEDGIKWLAPSYNNEHDLHWSPDSQKLALTRASWDLKMRELLICDTMGEDVQSLWKDDDNRWGVNEELGATWSPDSRKLAFISNQDGWNHLYVASIDSGESMKLTEGNYEVTVDGLYMIPGPQWSPDNSELAFISNQGSPHERHIWIVSADGGESRKLVEMKGICSSFWWSPDGKSIAFIHSGPAQPPSLWIVDTSGASDTVLVYTSRIEEFRKEKMANMEPVTYESSDGKSIPGVLMTPKHLQTHQKHPAIIYMYGWRSQWALLGFPRIYPSLFFDYMVQRGYVVLLVDPRGSWGYGKEHAAAIHLDPGGQHTEDVAAGAKYLAGLEYIDSTKIGITGVSGGGFMTMHNLIRFPEVYAAAIEEVGAFSWKDYYDEFVQEWVIPRLGMPEQNPDIYERTHLYNHVERIQAPLLMLAGTDDVNVLWSHAVKMVDALVQAGKEFDFMMYPGEPHRWIKPEVWRDALKRIIRFWDAHLKH